MFGLLGLLWSLLTFPFKSQAQLEAENLALRQQINVLRRKAPRRLWFTGLDRAILVSLYHLAPQTLDALAIVRPQTVISWHRHGFRAFWRWKSWSRGGRPKTPAEIRNLIRDMSLANPFWGAPRIHGELLKLGIDVGQTSVAKYMARRRQPPSQGWQTFLVNHAHGIASLDLFVVPTASFCLLYGLLILRHGRRQLVSFGVTANPTSEWIARQILEAFPWDEAPQHLIRDRDQAYGARVQDCLRSLGIRDHPTAPRSPWQNAYVERLIESVRRECLDHVVVFGEEHLRLLLKSYADYYNRMRTHLSLSKDAPVTRAIEAAGRIVSEPISVAYTIDTLEFEFPTGTGDGVC
jgi:transposase InsO family protein